jgi:hypothetical protein
VFVIRAYIDFLISTFLCNSHSKFPTIWTIFFNSQLHLAIPFCLFNSLILQYLPHVTHFPKSLPLSHFPQTVPTLPLIRPSVRSFVFVDIFYIPLKPRGFTTILVFGGTFNNSPFISWRSVLLVEETGVTGENHRPVASHWQTLSHNVVSNRRRLSGIRTHYDCGDRHWLHNR